MKKVILLAVCFVLLFQVSAFAETKIGVIDTQRIGEDSLYGKEIHDKLEAKFGASRKELAKEGAAINQLKKQLRAGAIDKELVADKTVEVNDRERSLNTNSKFLNQKVQFEYRKLAPAFLQKVQDAVLAYGEKNGYTIIYAKSPALTYIADGVDVTDAIIAELDKMKKAGK
ncbi:OmpH family outer membrane protein [Pseudodesulfovibrio sediminis]|uniref:Outer membrane chaperone Skp (OmpH) n=1 Tax=Pseudodesulfovibrio sediminis TaxID=2810563 RepID=A0ABM7P388_9BACT|nr:OmpH family outer membrane protein [Pseudodesulfovibrio sediminis]BCS87318.1 hypothetical protein PSDVSF_05600 [Pseudodesulfovibrio sediminis]